MGLFIRFGKSRKFRIENFYPTIELLPLSAHVFEDHQDP